MSEYDELRTEADRLRKELYAVEHKLLKLGNDLATQQRKLRDAYLAQNVPPIEATCINGPLGLVRL